MTVRIMVGYDGSAGSELAIDELNLLGLSAQVAVRVITVADTWPIYSNKDTNKNNRTDDEPIKIFAEKAKLLHEKATKRLADAHKLANKAAQRIKLMFPMWSVEPVAIVGSPVWEIIKLCDEWNANLILVGSQGHSAMDRFWFGSASHKIVNEARCSVHVARENHSKEGRPLRILLAADGSPDSTAATQQILARHWPAETEIRIVSAVDCDDEHRLSAIQSMHRLLEQNFVTLEYKVSSVIEDFNPQHLILQEAKNWSCDCIYIGSRGLNMFSRFLMGSVSSAIVARAHCSVEVVRAHRA